MTICDVQSARRVATRKDIIKDPMRVFIGGFAGGWVGEGVAVGGAKIGPSAR